MCRLNRILCPLNIAKSYKVNFSFWKNKQINIFGSTFYLCNKYILIFVNSEIKIEFRFSLSDLIFQIKKKTELAFCLHICKDILRKNIQIAKSFFMKDLLFLNWYNPTIHATYYLLHVIYFYKVLNLLNVAIVNLLALFRLFLL